MATVAECKGCEQGQHPDDAAEKILQENPDRYCMFPIRYDNMWRGFKKTETAFWTAEDLDLSKDPEDWDSLSPAERAAVCTTLGFMLSADRLLLQNVALRFLVDVEQPEARAFYSFQAFKQNIHAEAYSSVMATLVPDEGEQASLLRRLHSSPVMQQKVEWAQRRLTGDASFSHRLAACAAVESIFFSSSFCSFFQLKRRGLLPGLSTANDLISRDAAIDVEFAGIIYSELQGKLSQETLRELLEEAVSIEKEFVGDGGINVAALGLDENDMHKYIEFVADQLATTLGHQQIFQSANPFDWLETIALQGQAAKVQSQENKTANMSMAGVLKQVENRSYTLNFDEDF